MYSEFWMEYLVDIGQLGVSSIWGDNIKLDTEIGCEDGVDRTYMAQD